MSFGPELVSAAIAIATGLLVALLVEAIVAFRTMRRRKASTSDIRNLFLDFESKVTNAKESDDGMLKKEQIQFAFWDEHLDITRLVLAAHSPNIKQEHYLETMKLLDGWTRITRMVVNAGTGFGSDTYDRYFEAVRKLSWLKLK